MRLQYNGVLADGNGTIISGALVKVYLAGTATPASIYTSSTSTTVVNSVTTGTDGSYTFYVDTWDYGSYQTYKITFDATALGFSVTNTIDNIVVDNVVLGTYTISTAKVAAYPVKIPKGVVYSKSGSGTLTFSAELEAGQYQVFSGFTKGVDVTLSVTPLVVWEMWFDGSSTTGTETISTANITTATIGTVNLTTVNKTGTGLVTNLNADLLDSMNSATASTVSTIAARDSNGYLTAKQFISDIATGTAPLVVSSTTEVANLKAATATTADSATTATTATKVTDGTNLIHTKIIDIGDWDMDANATTTVTHGLTLSKIRQVTAMIRIDGDNSYHDINRSVDNTNTTPQGCVTPISSTIISLHRLDGGIFDSVNYDSTSFNRGWVVITYID